MRHLRFLRYVDEVARLGSIRKGAERLNVTASALNRRIMDLEEELGVELFERRARGVRLTATGEVFVHFLRRQIADTERMRSQIEDLRGLRRGLVRIACSQALAQGFLPRAIAGFRQKYPLIGFEVSVCDQAEAMHALAVFACDVALVFRPAKPPNFHALTTIKQRLVALMAEGHPLAARKSLRLADCTAYPLALSGKNTGGRGLLDDVAKRSGLRLTPAIESNSFEFLRGCVAESDAISFQIEIGALPAPLAGQGVVTRPIDTRDLPSADLVLGQLRERNLPVACAMFCEHVKTELGRFEPTAFSRRRTKRRAAA